MRVLGRILLGIVLGGTTTPESEARELRVVGTDLLGIEFSRALHAFARENNLRLALALDGSLSAHDELRTGRSDIGLLVLAPQTSVADFGGEFCAWPVAYHRAVVLALQGTPLTELTLDQLADVFGDGIRRVSRWSDHGVTEKGAESPLLALAPETGGGLALELFRHTVLGGRPLNARVARYATAEALKNRCVDGVRILAVASTAYPEIPILKPIAIAAQAGAPAFGPTPEALHTGDYPLRLPLHLVFRRSALATVRPLVRHLAGEGAVSHFERAGLVPLPPAARAQQLAALEKL